MKLLTRSIALVVCITFPAIPTASEREELLEIKNTIVNLVDALVDQGILTVEKAAALKAEAAKKAIADSQIEASVKTATEEVVQPVDVPTKEGRDGDTKKVVRVPYVPEFVKNEIREQVRAELREDVTKDVIAKAKKDRWGVKDALPDWISRITWSGDFRVRSQSEFYAKDNLPNSYPDFDAINDAGGVTQAGSDAFFNFTEDRNRLRVRLRLGFEAMITDSVIVNARMATGNLNNPISLHQTLGDSGDPYQLNLERAYLRWQLENTEKDNWLTVFAGRAPNPYFRPTELIFDNDIYFEGVSAKLSHDIPFVTKLRSRGGPSTGHGRKLFFNIGIFPLDEDEIAFADDSSNDKWLWGSQLGVEFAFSSLHSAMLAVAFHDYVNIAGKRNTLGSTITDWTAPESVTKGNTMFDIRNDADPTTNVFALASEFQLLNLSAEYRYAGFHPLQMVASADIVKNLGFDSDSIFRRTGADISERTLGYVLQFTLGLPEIERFGDWSMFAGYRYVQRDSLLDAFTDSNFHLGGTDAQGYYAGLLYGLTGDTWVRFRWLSSDEIDGPPLGIDTFQVDLNARF